MEKQLIWQGELCGRKAALYFNKYPFNFGGLLTFDTDRSNSQLLKTEDIKWLWEAGAQLSKTLPNLYFGYNSYGASCSIPTLHVHFILRDRLYPVEADKWKHNGGWQAYPTDCYTSERQEESAVWLNYLTENNIAFNLIQKAGKKDFWFPRQFQDRQKRQAFSELAGERITDNPLFFNAAAVEAFLASVRLPDF